MVTNLVCVITPSPFSR
ncbi:hypothetical protein Celaphus_00019189 [Cervus elaphus hippelaphus]|uniref:Uncharacterized protein n=1 Tax=Cervus elaphus hippelaphus TaxID=46360 RepID=A0A212C7S3_CEREH|nr:hypothetical protein Celaphus_00019189 [Cervus elaphus hippelaphus]